MKIAITGGSGFVRRALTRHLYHDHHVLWLSSHHAALPDKLTAEFKNLDVKLVDYQHVDSLSATNNYLSLQKPSISKRWDWDKMAITPEPIRLSKLH